MRCTKARAQQRPFSVSVSPSPTPTFSLFICSFPSTRGGSQRHLGRQGANFRIQNINFLLPSTPITTTRTCKMMLSSQLRGFECLSRLIFKAHTAVEGKKRTFWLVSLPYFAPALIVHFLSWNLPSLVPLGSGKWEKALGPGPCSILTHSRPGQPETQQLGTRSQWFMQLQRHQNWGPDKTF